MIKACTLAQPEEDEELGQWASATPPLVRAEYAWLSAAKHGACAFLVRSAAGAVERNMVLRQILARCQWWQLP